MFAAASGEALPQSLDGIESPPQPVDPSMRSGRRHGGTTGAI